MSTFQSPSVRSRPIGPQRRIMISTPSRQRMAKTNGGRSGNRAAWNPSTSSYHLAVAPTSVDTRVGDHAERTEQRFRAVGFDTRDARELTAYSRDQKAGEMVPDVDGW